LSLVGITVDTMMMWMICLAICLQGFLAFSTSDENLGATQKQLMHEPTVMVAILVRNKAHTLPWFLYYLQNLDYPKHRIRLWYLYFCLIANNSTVFREESSYGTPTWSISVNKQ